jgi:ribosome modulation factor
MTPFEEGLAAGRAGQTYSQCPYRAGSHKAQAWLHGWIEALEQRLKESRRAR